MTKENEELKPCPFCGSTQQSLVTDHASASTTVYRVDCKGPGNLNGYCNAQGPRNFQSIELAINAWNTRASELEAKLEGFRAARQRMEKAKLKNDSALLKSYQAAFGELLLDSNVSGGLVLAIKHYVEHLESRRVADITEA